MATAVHNTRIISNLQGALRRLRKGDLAAVGADDDSHDEGAHDVLAFLTDRCGWTFAPGDDAGPVFVGTGVGPTARIAVIVNLNDALNHADALDRSVGLRVDDVPAAERTAALAGVANQLVQQVDRYRQPFGHQVRALAMECIRWLEAEANEGARR